MPWKKGQSGNPQGRRKKPVHVGAIIDSLLNRKISVRVDGEKVKMSGVEALLRKAFAEALKGDHRMMKLAKARPDARTEDPDQPVPDCGLNDKIADLLARIEMEKGEKAKEVS